MKRRILFKKQIDKLPETIFLTYYDKELKKWVVEYNEIYNTYGMGWKTLLVLGIENMAVERKLNPKTEIKLLQAHWSAEKIEDIGFKEVDLNSL